VLYKLYLNCPRMINLHDLYIDFVGEVAPGRTPTDDDEEALYRYGDGSCTRARAQVMRAAHEATVPLGAVAWAL